MSREVAERRVNPRFPAVFELDGVPTDGGVVARMQASDISLGGLRCLSTTDFPEMTKLAVRLELPHERDGRTEPLDVQAVVVRSREIASNTNVVQRYELALFFTGLEDGTRERIARFLDR